MSHTIDKQRVELQTTDATPTVIWEYDIPNDPSAGGFYIHVWGRREDNDDVNSWRIRGVFRLESGAADYAESRNAISIGSAGISVIGGVSGTRYQVTVTGVAGVNVQWRFLLRPLFYEE